jgi:hypothetical protein
MKEMMSQSIQNLKIGIGSFFKMEVEKIPSWCFVVLLLFILLMRLL